MHSFHRPPLAGLGLLLFGLLSFATAEAQQRVKLYVGTGASGIYFAEFEPTSATLTEPTKVAQTQRPTFLWIHPDGETLYSVSELYGQSDGSGPTVIAWAIDPATGALRELNRQDARGDGPCFVTVRDDGRYAAIANYGSGSVSLYPIRDDGSLAPASGHVQHAGSSVNADRQSSPHAHCVRFDPSGERVVVADLGTDKVYLYEIKDDGSLSPSTPTAVDMPAGSGPRHLVFSPDGDYLYVLGELSGTVTLARYAPPTVEVVETVSTMAAGTPAEANRSSAEILLHPSGRWLYASNRGPSEIAIFRVDRETGRLERIGSVSSGGETPRNFRLTPDGDYLVAANQDSDNLVVFSIQPETGKLKTTGIEENVPSPQCLKFLSSGHSGHSGR
jgi:6-phosphogluconolactonase